MEKCNSCGKEDAEYEVFGTSKKICSECIGGFFTCPRCGRVFKQDDYTFGDAGNDFCAECSKKLKLESW